MNKISRLTQKLLVLLVIFFTEPICIGLAQGYFPDISLMTMYEITKSGRVKFREDWLYTFENGKMSPKGIKIGFDRFDSLGQIVEEANYDLKGNSLLEVTYTYDEWGREIQRLGSKGNEKFYYKWSYLFVDSTKCLEKKVHHNPANKKKWVYKFDANGNIYEELNYNSDGELNYRYLIRYTKFGKPAELIEYSGNGTMYEKWIYLYNKQYQNIEIMQFDAAGELFKKYRNKYDEMGNKREIYVLDKNDNELERTLSIYQFYK